MKRLVVALVIAIVCTRSVGQMVHMQGDLTEKPPKDLPPPTIATSQSPTNCSASSLLAMSVENSFSSYK